MREIRPSDLSLNDFLEFSNNDAVKALAASNLARLNLPGKKTEHYRYFSIDRVLGKNYLFFEPYLSEVKESEEIVIKNGVLISAPKDLKISLKSDRFLDKEHFDNVYYLNHLLSKEVIEIDVEKDSFIKIKHIFDKEGVFINYRIFLNIDNEVKVNLFEKFEGEALDSLIFYGIDAKVGERDSFEWIRVQDVENATYSMIGSHRVYVKKGGKFDIKTYDIGDGHISHNLKADMFEGSLCEAKHMVYADKNAIRANITQLNHKERSVSVNQDARHVLKDKATAIFDAVVRVDKDSKKAIAHQNNRSILLNDKAYMVSKPQLEIYTDELEASHGSTTGAIDEEEIFYMRARGIDKKTARKMIVFGFMKEIIDAIEDKEILKDVLERFERVYEKDEI